MKLLFLRHGLADRSAWSGSDYERPLTPRGKERMRAEAETIASLDLGLDAILTSPLTRASQTAEIVADQLGLLDRLIEDDRAFYLTFDNKEVGRVIARPFIGESEGNFTVLVFQNIFFLNNTFVQILTQIDDRFFPFTNEFTVNYPFFGILLGDR